MDRGCIFVDILNTTLNLRQNKRRKRERRPTEMCIPGHQKPCATIFVAVLYMIAKNWEKFTSHQQENQ